MEVYTALRIHSYNNPLGLGKVLLNPVTRAISLPPHILSVSLQEHSEAVSVPGRQYVATVSSAHISSIVILVTHSPTYIHNYLCEVFSPLANKGLQ